MRTTKPANNKYYITVAKGGASQCIEGKPKDSKANVLANCFSGNTEYITKEGLKTFRDTEDSVQEVLNENGEFVPAEIKCFGEQKIYKITFRNGYVVEATGNHRWVVERKSHYKDKTYTSRKIKTTLELKAKDCIPYNYAKTSDELDEKGIVHGMVFGDGYKNKNCNTYKLELLGNKQELSKYIKGSIHGDMDLKEVPDIHERDEYLKGFLAGLIATDGTITKNTFKISNDDKLKLEQIRDICYKVGVAMGDIYTETRDVSVGKYICKCHQIHYLTFKRKGIEKLLIKTADKEKISDSFRNITKTQIVSVEDTGRYEVVYCAVEPITHTITLKNNILTGQCVGYASGRYNEIIGHMKYPYLNCNAEGFINRAKKTYPGIKIEYDINKGTVGSIIVWEGVGNLAGHVAVIEKVYGPGDYFTSESSYGGKAFFNARRSNKNGRLGMSSNYKFLGFLKNEAIKDEPVDPFEGIRDEELAKRVWKGEFGNGNDRKNALGIRYNSVQALVDRGVGKPTPPKPKPETNELKVGDKVEIINRGCSTSFGGGSRAYGIGWTREVLKIHEGRAYPYQIGLNGATTGFYKAEALKKK